MSPISVTTTSLIDTVQHVPSYHHILDGGLVGVTLHAPQVRVSPFATRWRRYLLGLDTLGTRESKYKIFVYTQEVKGNFSL